MRGGGAELGSVTEVRQLDHWLGGHVFHHDVLWLREQRAHVIIFITVLVDVHHFNQALMRTKTALLELNFFCLALLFIASKPTFQPELPSLTH